MMAMTVDQKINDNRGYHAALKGTLNSKIGIVFLSLTSRNGPREFS
jgi:hypothetical protein